MVAVLIGHGRQIGGEREINLLGEALQHTRLATRFRARLSVLLVWHCVPSSIITLHQIAGNGFQPFLKASECKPQGCCIESARYHQPASVLAVEGRDDLVQQLGLQLHGSAGNAARHFECP